MTLSQLLARLDADATKGPLRLPTDADEDFIAACVLSADGFLVADCNVFGSDAVSSDTMCEANARLFATLRNLLPRLRGIVEAGAALEALAVEMRGCDPGQLMAFGERCALAQDRLFSALAAGDAAAKECTPSPESTP